MKNIIIIILSVAVYILYVNVITLRSNIKAFKLSNKELNGLVLKQSEKALTYQLISIELSNLCDKYQSSRNAKNKNKKYFKLLEKIN